MSACYGWLRGFRRNGLPAQRYIKTARGFASVWAELRNRRGDRVEAWVTDNGNVEVKVNGRSVFTKCEGCAK